MAGSASNWFRPKYGALKGQSVYLTRKQQFQIRRGLSGPTRTYGELNKHDQLAYDRGERPKHEMVEMSLNSIGMGQFESVRTKTLAEVNKHRPAGAPTPRVPKIGDAHPKQPGIKNFEMTDREIQDIVRKHNANNPHHQVSWRGDTARAMGGGTGTTYRNYDPKNDPDVVFSHNNLHVRKRADMDRDTYDVVDEYDGRVIGGANNPQTARDIATYPSDFVIRSIEEGVRPRYSSGQVATPKSGMMMPYDLEFQEAGMKRGG